MRVVIAAAAVAVVSLMALDSSFTQASAQANMRNRCVELAARQGLSTKSASGRNFVARCMQRGTYGSSPNYRPSRNCPDDPRARSAYPSWMCP
jgi:hypothetical protein